MAIAASSHGVAPIVTDGKPAGNTIVPVLSTGCSRRGSRASRSPRSASARWYRPRSCRSPQRTCSPDTIPNPATHHEHFGGSAFALSKLGLPLTVPVYAGFLAVAVNLIVSIVGTLIARAAKVADGVDATAGSDYFADEGDPKLAAQSATGY